MAAPIVTITMPANACKDRPRWPTDESFVTNPSVKAAASTNGTPSPSEYVDSNTTPLATVADVALTVRIAPRMGPMQGVHPKPNANPSR